MYKYILYNIIIVIRAHTETVKVAGDIIFYIRYYYYLRLLGERGSFKLTERKQYYMGVIESW